MGKQAGQLLKPAGSSQASKPSSLSDSTPPVETFLGGGSSPRLGLGSSMSWAQAHGDDRELSTARVSRSPNVPESSLLWSPVCSLMSRSGTETVKTRFLCPSTDGGKKHVYILELPVEGHYVLYCEGQRQGKLVRVGKLIGEGPPSCPRISVS